MKKSFRRSAKIPTPFDRFTREYDLWFDTHPLAYQSELEAIRRFIPAAGSGVEVGVGTGRFAARLGIGIGVEPSEPMAAMARSAGLKVIRANGEELPFKNGSFDFILLANVICFVFQPLVLLKEASRILRPTGRIILAFIDRESELGKKYESRKASSRFYKNATFYSPSRVIEFLHKAGFHDFEACQTLFTNPLEMAAPDPVLDCYGQGSYVVLKELKK